MAEEALRKIVSKSHVSELILRKESGMGYKDEVGLWEIY